MSQICWQAEFVDFYPRKTLSEHIQGYIYFLTDAQRVEIRSSLPIAWSKRLSRDKNSVASTDVKPHSPATPASGALTITPKPVSETAKPDDDDKTAENPPKVTAEAWQTAWSFFFSNLPVNNVLFHPQVLSGNHILGTLSNRRFRSRRRLDDR